MKQWSIKTSVSQYFQAHCKRNRKMSGYNALRWGRRKWVRHIWDLESGSYIRLTAGINREQQGCQIMFMAHRESHQSHHPSKGNCKTMDNDKSSFHSIDLITESSAPAALSSKNNSSLSPKWCLEPRVIVILHITELYVPVVKTTEDPKGILKTWIDFWRMMENWRAQSAVEIALVVISFTVYVI